MEQIRRVERIYSMPRNQSDADSPLETNGYNCYTNKRRRFDYDPEKSRLNVERHGVDLHWARRLWDATHVVVPAKCVTGERRFLILARVERKCYAAVFTMRGQTVRLISCHRADKRLERTYEDKIRSEKDR